MLSRKKRSVSNVRRLKDRRLRKHRRNSNSRRSSKRNSRNNSKTLCGKQLRSNLLLNNSQKKFKDKRRRKKTSHQLLRFNPNSKFRKEAVTEHLLRKPEN